MPNPGSRPVVGCHPFASPPCHYALPTCATQRISPPPGPRLTQLVVTQGWVRLSGGLTTLHGEINRVRSADLVRRRVLDTVWDSSRWSKLQILFVWVFWFVDRLIRQGGCHQSCSMGWPPTQSLSVGRGTPPYPRPEPSGSSHQHHSVSSVQTRPSIFCSPNQSCRGLYLFCGAGYFRAP